MTGVTPKTKVREYYNPPSRLFVSPADIKQSRYVNVTEKRISDAGLMFGQPIPKDAIIVVCIGSTIGKVAMASERCLTNQQINSIICSDRNPSVVYYMLRRSASLFKQNASCTAVPILNKGAFSSYESSNRVTKKWNFSLKSRSTTSSKLPSEIISNFAASF